MTSLTVTVNGEPRALATGSTVGDALRVLRGEVPPSGLAVAVNGEVVRRRDWDATSLHDGDRVEVVAAVQGGARDARGPRDPRAPRATRQGGALRG